MKKSALKIMSAIMALSIIGIPYSDIIPQSDNSLTVQALEQTSELSSISVFSGKSRQIDVTVPIGYEFSIDDIEDLNFKKVYEVSHINTDGEKVIDYYDHKPITMEELEKDCKITTKFQDKSENQKHFIVSLEYIGDEAESVLCNSLFVTITYDAEDHSVYGENYISQEAVFIVDDEENEVIKSGYYYHFEGGEKIEECDHEIRDAENIRRIDVTEDNNKFLLDSGAFYVQAEYNFRFHSWSYNKIKKADTVETMLTGNVTEIDSENNTFTVRIDNNNQPVDVIYPIDAEYVYIAMDLDIGNNVTLTGYNVTSENWYTEPYRLYVEPSWKVTLSDKITNISGHMVTAVFDGMFEKTFYVNDVEGAKVGDILYVKNYGDCITEEWFDNPLEVWIEKSEVVVKEEVYGDANCDNEVDVRDVTAVAQHIVKLNPLSEQGIKNCDIFCAGTVDVKSLSQIKKYLIKSIDKLEKIDSYMPEFSVLWEGGEGFVGTKVYKSAEELQNDFTSKEILSKYDDEYFKNNVLCVQSICVNSMLDNIYVDNAEKDENGNFKVTLTETFSSPAVTDLALFGYVVCMEISADKYTGQTFEYELKDTYKPSQAGTYTDTAFITDADDFRSPMDINTNAMVFTEYQDFRDYIDSFYYNVYTTDGIDYMNSAGTELLDIYKKQFFEDNVLFIQRLQLGCCEPSLSVEYVQEDTCNHITMSILDNCNADCDGLSGCFAGFTMPKSEYDNHVFTVNLSINPCITAQQTAFVTKLDMFWIDNQNTDPMAFENYDDFINYINTFSYPEPDESYDTDYIREYPAGYELTETYDESFFEDNVLFIRRIVFRDDGYDLSINSVTRYENGNFSLNIDNNYEYTFADDVMTGCFSGFALPKSQYNGELFTIDINNAARDTY